jgi:large subunit ribosomal protein L33
MLFKLISTAETGYFYVGKKSVELAGQKLQLMKFDPLINRHVLFLESKLKAKKKR